MEHLSGSVKPSVCLCADVKGEEVTVGVGALRLWDGAGGVNTPNRIQGKLMGLSPIVTKTLWLFLNFRPVCLRTRKLKTITQL